MYKCEGWASDSTPLPLDNKLDTPVKVPITHSIQNKTWRDVHDVLPSTITLKINVMATNVIKSVKYDTYEGKFTGMITINLANEVDGNIITEDGVFGVGKTKKIRVNVSYLMAIMRNHEIHGAALSVWLDALKANPLPLRQASWTMALINQEIDVEPVLKDADEDHAEEWYSHDVKIITVSKDALIGAYATMISVTNPWLTDAKLVMEQARQLIAAVEAE